MEERYMYVRKCELLDIRGIVPRVCIQDAVKS